MRSEYFWRMRSASALRFSKGCSSLNLLRMVAGVGEIAVEGQRQVSSTCRVLCGMCTGASNFAAGEEDTRLQRGRGRISARVCLPRGSQVRPAVGRWEEGEAPKLKCAAKVSGCGIRSVWLTFRVRRRGTAL